MKERAETSGREEEDFVDLRLYVADRTPWCLTAYTNIKKICEAYSPGKYRITVIDLLKKPRSRTERGYHCRSDPDPCSPDPGEPEDHRDAHGYKKSP